MLCLDIVGAACWHGAPGVTVWSRPAPGRKGVKLTPRPNCNSVYLLFSIVVPSRPCLVGRLV